MSDTPPVNSGTVPPVEDEKHEEQQIRINASATAVIDDSLKTVDIVTPLDEILAALGKEALESEDK